MTLERVTFTGADDQTPIEQMADLSRAYPWIEWGILMPHMGGRRRFPSPDWVCRLIDHPGLNLAAHICPPWTSKFYEQDTGVVMLLKPAFQRIQINTHGHLYSARQFAMDAMLYDAREYIIQLDGLNDSILDIAIEHGATNITGLYDKSHGNGERPALWPPSLYPLHWIGYAGGLGPDNLDKELPRILEAAGETPVWIDMESRVRTNERFDLTKVHQCINIAEPYIVTHRRAG